MCSGLMPRRAVALRVVKGEPQHPVDISISMSVCLGKTMILIHKNTQQDLYNNPLIPCLGHCQCALVGWFCLCESDPCDLTGWCHGFKPILQVMDCGIWFHLQMLVRTRPLGRRGSSWRSPSAPTAFTSKRIPPWKPLPD